MITVSTKKKRYNTVLTMNNIFIDSTQNKFGELKQPKIIISLFELDDIIYSRKLKKKKQK